MRCRVGCRPIDPHVGRPGGGECRAGRFPAPRTLTLLLYSRRSHRSAARITRPPPPSPEANREHPPTHHPPRTHPGPPAGPAHHRPQQGTDSTGQVDRQADRAGTRPVARSRTSAETGFSIEAPRQHRPLPFAFVKAVTYGSSGHRARNSGRRTCHLLSGAFVDSQRRGFSAARLHEIQPRRKPIGGIASPSGSRGPRVPPRGRSPVPNSRPRRKSL
jgi:hypothetical protein